MGGGGRGPGELGASAWLAFYPPGRLCRASAAALPSPRPQPAATGLGPRGRASGRAPQIMDQQQQPVVHHDDEMRYFFPPGPCGGCPPKAEGVRGFSPEACPRRFPPRGTLNAPAGPCPPCPPRPPCHGQKNIALSSLSWTRSLLVQDKLSSFSAEPCRPAGPSSPPWAPALGARLGRPPWIFFFFFQKK